MRTCVTSMWTCVQLRCGSEMYGGCCRTAVLLHHRWRRNASAHHVTSVPVGTPLFLCEFHLVFVIDGQSFFGFPYRKRPRLQRLFFLPSTMGCHSVERVFIFHFFYFFLFFHFFVSFNFSLEEVEKAMRQVYMDLAHGNCSSLWRVGRKWKALAQQVGCRHES